LWDDLDRRDRDARIVLALVLAVLGFVIVPVREPFCVMPEDHYVPPDSLTRTVVLAISATAIFGPLFAAFGPRWRLERLSVEPIYGLG
jgi:hypothetical protein